MESSTARRQPILNDPTADDELARVGAVVVPFLPPTDLESLRASLERLGQCGERGFHDTASAGLAFEPRQVLHDVLCEAFRARSESLLVDHDPVMSSFLTKWPGPDSDKEIHRDFRLVDEPRFRSVCVWVPFVDVDERNGALSVLPGSHLVDTGPRSVPITPSVPVDPVRSLRFSDLDVVPARVGEAVVFDMAVAHGSDENRTDLPRPAAAVAYAPKAARLSLSFCHPDDSVELLEVVDPDVFRRIDWKQRPAELTSLGTIEHDREAVSVQDLVRRSRELVARDAGTAVGRRDA